MVALERRFIDAWIVLSDSCFEGRVGWDAKLKKPAKNIFEKSGYLSFPPYFCFYFPHRIWTWNFCFASANKDNFNICLFEYRNLFSIKKLFSQSATVMLEVSGLMKASKLCYVILLHLITNRNSHAQKQIPTCTGGLVSIMRFCCRNGIL